jgi:hypothetical protein
MSNLSSFVLHTTGEKNEYTENYRNRYHLSHQLHRMAYTGIGHGLSIK